jgi:hypothetical protein
MCFMKRECARLSGWVAGVGDHEKGVANVLDDVARIEEAIEVG